MLLWLQTVCLPISTFRHARAELPDHDIDAFFTVDFGASSDTLGKLTPPFVWTNLEVSIGVIAASLPTLGPLRKAYRQNVRAHFRSSESHSVSLVAVSEQISQMNSASKGFQKLHSESYLEVSALHAGKRTESQNEGGKPDSKQPGINDSLA